MKASVLARSLQPAAGDDRARAWLAARATEGADARRRRAMPPDRLLPPAGWLGRWEPADKHSVVAAVRVGQLRLSDACGRYMLGLEEFCSWWDEFRDGPELSDYMAEGRALRAEVTEWL